MCRSRGERSIIITSGLAKQAEELIGVLRDQLCQLRIASAQLCKNGFQHRRLLLDDLTQLLKLGVMSQKIEVAESLLALALALAGSGSGSYSGSSRGAGRRAASRARPALLGSEVE